MCQQETGDLHDFLAVAVTHGYDTVGHVLHIVSIACNIFLTLRSASTTWSAKNTCLCINYYNRRSISCYLLPFYSL